MNEICKETCIIVDRCSQFLQNSGSKLEIDPSQKTRGTLSFLSTLQKTTWTCIVEGVTEYCRIVFDIFPAVHKIQVLCSDEAVSNVNSFDEETQTIQHVLKGFGDLGPPKRISEWAGPVSVYPGVAQGAEILLVKSTKDTPKKVTKRLLVITSLEDESDANSISNVVWEMQNQQDKASVCHIDLVVVNISSKGDIINNKKEISSHLNATTMTLKTSHCAMKISKLTRVHYNLHSTIITGIPMKEEQHAGTSANYDVEIIHSAAAHLDADWLAESSSRKDFSSRLPVTLKWCTPKANTIQDLQPCFGAYKVTPSEVNSRPAACLIMFLLQGRTVMLEAPKKSGAKVLTHMLQCHGGDVYIHVLASGRSPLEDPPTITEGIGGRVTDYRINDFGKFMKENRLAPYMGSSDQEENKMALSRLERYSKHWPMVISDTLIFNMPASLDPLLTLLLKPTLSEDEVQECKKVIFKLQAMESRSDSLPLPIVTLKGKGTKKEEQYKQVWAELDLYIEGASTTSFMHKKVLDCTRGSQETQETKPNDESKTTEPSDKSWTELDRYQQMTEREKKAFNEAPSDPRRRRRISESSSKSNGQQQQQQKSPNNKQDQEPPGKVRRNNTTRNNFSNSNITATIQAKSSLLSIWSNHLNLTASRLHEEFIGRKQSVNGKFELYQKDPELISQPEAPKVFNNKSVKEWV